MNPFVGFMQAVTGSVPGFGDKTANIGKNVHGLPDNDDAMLLSDDNTRSFLAWVQNFMDNAATVDAGGESVFNFQPSDLDSELPALDQLQALIAEAMNQSSTGGDVSPTMKTESFKDGHVPLPQGIINTIIAHHESSPFSDTPAPDVLSDVPEIMVAHENTTALGQTQAAAKDLLFQTAVSGAATQAGISDESQIKENTPALEQTQTAAKDPILQAAVSGVPTQAGQMDEHPNKDHHLDWVMKENTPGEGLEKQITRSLSKPVATESDGAQANSNRLIQERLPSGMGTAERANGPATHPVQPIAGQAKGPESIVTGLADQQAPSSDDDTANFQGSAKHNPTQRVALADINEDEGQKGQASDSVKSTVSELTKSPPSFQDTEKALTGDQSTNMAVKPTTGQAAALTRTEDSAAKTFQTTVMDQIVDKAAMRSIHGRSEIQIRLKPEFLGNVQMNIAADKEQLVVRILTDRPMVKEIIETHLHQLRTELQNHGLTIDKFEVMVNPDAEQQNSRDQFAQMFKHHSSQNGRRQPHEQEPETLSRDGSKNPDDDQPNRDGVNYFA